MLAAIRAVLRVREVRVGGREGGRGGGEAGGGGGRGRQLGVVQAVLSCGWWGTRGEVEAAEEAAVAAAARFRRLRSRARLDKCSNGPQVPSLSLQVYSPYA